MNCTSCNNGVLKETLLEVDFWAQTCSSCGGNWILIEDFAVWKESNLDYNFSDDISVEDAEITDSKKAILCPSSGTIMRKFRVSAANEHKIDYSSKVGGVWLDKGEWELLKSEGLAGSLNSILTNHWQAKIKQANAATNFSEFYLEKFGSESYEKAKEFREWLINHELKSDLKAYVLADDPYSADK
jgi:Zn-finger nucleic acid-binding protein